MDPFICFFTSQVWFMGEYSHISTEFDNVRSYRIKIILIHLITYQNNYCVSINPVKIALSC